MRKRSCGAVLASLILSGATAANALANGTGGVSVAPPTTPSKTTGGSTPAKPTVPAHASPITAKTPNVAYKGPVYEKTTVGTIVPYVPAGQSGETQASTGGAAVAATVEGKPELLVPGSLARYVDGYAAAPMAAPATVQEIIWAGNQIVGLPYIYGGGHDASFISPGYDCSGTVSFALHGAELLSAPLDSGEFMSWGAAGEGRWVTIFTNPGHAYMTVAGLRLDTSPAYDPSNLQGPRWRPLRPNNTGFTVRHPLGL